MAGTTRLELEAFCGRERSRAAGERELAAEILTLSEVKGKGSRTWLLPTRNELGTREEMAGTTRLELATSAVTGQRSNQLNYVPASYNYRKWARSRGQPNRTAERAPGSLRS